MQHTILIVDDDYDILSMTRQLLEEEHYEVVRESSP